MKQLILDHIRRWWWVVALVGIVHFSISWAFFYSSRSTFFFPTPVFLGALLLSYDLQRGHARALLSLPVSSRQLARAWWWSCVGIPAVFLSLLSLLAYGLARYAGAVHAPAGNLYGLSLLMHVLLLGALFFMLTWLSGRPAVSLWEQVRQGLFGIFWGGSIGAGAWLFQGIAWGSLKTNVILLVGAAMTIVGWWRAEDLVQQRAGVRAAAQRRLVRAAQHRVSSGFGGLPFLVQTFVLRLVYFSAFFLGIMLVMQVVVHGRSTLSPHKLLAATLPATSFYPYLAIFMVVMPSLLHLRLLRTLPLSPFALAATLVLLPAGSILILGALFTCLSHEALGGNSAELFMGYAFGAAAAAMCIPFLVWQGLTRGAYLAVMLLVMLAAISSTLFQAFTLSPAAALAIAFGLMALAVGLTSRLLQRSSEAYRVRSLPLGATGLYR